MPESQAVLKLPTIEFWRVLSFLFHWACYSHEVVLQPFLVHFDTMSQSLWYSSYESILLIFNLIHDLPIWIFIVWQPQHCLLLSNVNVIQTYNGIMITINVNVITIIIEFMFPGQQPHLQVVQTDPELPRWTIQFSWAIYRSFSQTWLKILRHSQLCQQTVSIVACTTLDSLTRYAHFVYRRSCWGRGNPLDVVAQVFLLAPICRRFV